MMMPLSLAAWARGAGGRPVVVLPSVKRTMTLALPLAVSSRSVAFWKASPWLVLPLETKESTAAFRASTEVLRGASTWALLAKLTTPMRLPEPIWPSAAPPVASARMSMKVFAPSFMLARGVPAMLPERSRTRAMSVGLAMMLGAAVSARVTCRDPSQSTRRTLTVLLAFVTPIVFPPSGKYPGISYAGRGSVVKNRRALARRKAGIAVDNLSRKTYNNVECLPCTLARARI